MTRKSQEQWGKVGDHAKASQYFRNMCLLVKNPESPATIFERWKVMDHPILKEFPRGVRFYVDGTEIRCDIPSNSTRAQSSIFIVQALSYSQVPVIDPTAYPYLGISVSRHRIHIERSNC